MEGGEGEKGDGGRKRARGVPRQLQVLSKEERHSAGAKVMSRALVSWLSFFIIFLLLCTGFDF